MPFADASTLATFTGDDSLDGPRGDMLCEQASAIIRTYCRQTFDLVADDDTELRGTTAQRLLLPERPVVDVTSVTVAGVTVDNYDRVRDGLWRAAGWGGSSTLVQVTYTHGFAADSPTMETLKAVCLQVAARAAANPSGFSQFSDAAGTNIGFVRLGLTAAEQAILDRFRHEQAAAL